jgi:hypothetical protein
MLPNYAPGNSLAAPHILPSKTAAILPQEMQINYFTPFIIITGADQ